MITVTATQAVLPGKEDEIDTLMSGLITDIRAHEPGCLSFDYIRSDVDPRQRLVVEQYRDVIAFEYHKTRPYLAEFFPALLACLQRPPEVSVYGDVFAPAPPASFFHVGMVVPDLEKAIARYSDVLGIPFTEPGVFDIPRLEDPHAHPFKLTAAFSRTEPPYYELIQADGDGITSARHCGKILYYGCWEADMAGRLESLRENGVGVDALFRMDAESAPFAIITAPDLLGARIEYVGADSLGPIEEWVATGVLPAGVGA
jgi:quinol monooxygenase YgiN/catechol 2,3-dioxygenase-like lactoylglutathione lyase family enzyme